MKNLILFLSFASALTAVLGISVRDGSGTCGDNLTWVFNSTTNTLTISGTGKMTDYHSSGSIPWGSYCRSITKVVINDGVTSIGVLAFNSCVNLISVTIPSTVTSIGSCSFNNCNKLPSIDIPEGVKTVEDGAFLDCKSFTSFTFPASVSTIGIRVFESCSNLTKIEVNSSNNNYISVGGILFNKQKTTLVRYPPAIQGNYTIPSSVTKIEEYAFEGCVHLASVSIPENVTNIGDEAFYRCTNLSSIKVSSSNSKYESINDVLFNRNTHMLIKYPAGKTGEYTIPPSAKSIDIYAFFECTGLTSITIPSSITSIGKFAFRGCTKLTSVNLSANITSIQSFTFGGCSSLTSIIIPSSVTSIESNAFDGCTSLKSITFEGNISSIGSSAFRSCSRLTSIVIPKNVSTIGNGAFQYCSSLTSITIPPKVSTVESSTFYGCNSLKSILLEGNITSIGTHAFYDCKSLTSFIIPDSVSVIGYIAFRGCASLPSITIPPKVTKIESDTFYGCSSLKSVIFKGNITSIGSSAFSYCNKLASIIIPDSVSSIGKNAFYECKNLQSLSYLGDSDPGISSSNVFNGCESLNMICASESYNSTSFCGKNISCRSSFCEKLNNQCYESVIEGFICKSKMIESVQLLEDESNGCVEYSCDNESGTFAIPKCNNNDNITICVDGECIDEKDIKDRRYKIEIEMKDETILTTPNDIATELSNMTSIDVSDMTIGVEYDGDGKYITRIIVYVNDKEQAKTIEDKVRILIDTSESCELYLCRSKSVRVEVLPLELLVSRGCINHISIIMMLSALIVGIS